MQAYELADLISQRADSNKRYLEFLKVPDLSMGLYVLPAGGVDPQSPHTEDEVYYVASGRAQIRVADERGRDVDVGEIGEVLVRGDSVMAGYWRNPEASAAALREGWLWTGDVGALDADGFLTLKDRSKDLVISGGSNIYPREVEEVLLTAPGVAEVACVGAPDAEWGEVIVAFVVPQPGRRIDEAALDAHCLQRIARFKRPKRYLVVDALPKNNYGKVLKTELRARLR